MSRWDYCRDCREYGSFGTGFMDHKCKPKWECRLEAKWMSDDDWCVTHGRDSEEAAEKFAERYDADGGEYHIVSGRGRGDTIVQVRKPGEDQNERFSIEAEAVPTYYGHKIADAKSVNAETNS